MPCDTELYGITAEERAQQVQEAIAKLEAQLASGEVTVKIGPEGSVAFVGWGEERNGVTDLCAYRRLEHSWALKHAVEHAEAEAGRQVDKEAVAAGVHSHDGGKSWGKH